MVEHDAKIDNLLMGVLQECKTHVGFLHAIFGFLQRHTDFYHVQKDSTDKMGFPAGVRESLVYEAMNYFDPEKLVTDLTSTDLTDPNCFVPPAVQEIEIDESSLEIEEIDEPIADQSNEKWPTSNPEIKSTPPTKPDDVRDIHKVSPAFSPEEYKNGAALENYCWSQTISEVDVNIVLPANVKSAKQLIISLEASSISVLNRLDNLKILEGKMWGKCKHHDIVWTMQDSRLNIHLDKMQEIWWDKFLIHENAIDPKNIEYERDLSELPDEARTKLHEISSQENIPNKAYCTSEVPPNVMPVDEQMERLRRAWDADDSPFKGTPFDPVMVKLDKK